MIYEINSIRFSYRNEEAVFCDVSFNIGKGDVVSVLGPNGAGKSTLLNCMMGLLKPDSGSIKLFGDDIFSLSPGELAKKVSFVPQTIKPVFGYTVFEFVLMGRAPLVSVFSRPGKEDKKAAMETIERMGLLAFSDRSYTELSGGQMQQASIARAIVRKPQVILFDEPAAHLDFGNKLKMLKIIKELSSEGFTTVMTTHDPDHAVILGGNTAILDNTGHFLFGSTDKMITEQNLQRIYNTPVKIRYIEEVGRNVCLYPDI